MDKIKRIILLRVPMSICNFKCNYCYLAQRDVSFENKQAEYKYSCEEVRKALSKKRLGGPCYINICADGETLLAKNIVDYIYQLALEGHYIEIVTNLSATPVINEIISWDKEILNHISFKCSFHFLELKRLGLLEVFSKNVNSIWNAGGSATIEITPSDELIPYINEVMEFSYANFGALPHLTIARDDNNQKAYLTSLNEEEYNNVWSQFDSDFWKFKKEIFGVKRKEYCYAGKWSLYVDLCTGETIQCYCSEFTQNIFEHPEKPIKFVAIGKCSDDHCYNGHALLTLGVIPGFTSYKYGDIRDRKTTSGKHWLSQSVLDFFNSTLEESNKTSNALTKTYDSLTLKLYRCSIIQKRICNKIIRTIKKPN